MTSLKGEGGGKKSPHVALENGVLTGNSKAKGDEHKHCVLVIKVVSAGCGLAILKLW
jgi:hypothetical protein